MKVLLPVPQPFYQLRGTPIAVNQLASDPPFRAELGERALRAARIRYAPGDCDRTAFPFRGFAERLLPEDGHPGTVVNTLPH